MPRSRAGSTLSLPVRPELAAGADGLRATYARAVPFPHLSIPELLPEARSRAVAEAFPTDGSPAWTTYAHFNERKAGLTDAGLFPVPLRQLVDELNAEPFLGWLSEVTGVPKLLADPSLEGGGLHMTRRGGFLRIHADFTAHHHRRRWRRRCNLILFLNPHWEEEWGGQLELWARDMSECRAKIEPRLNQAVLFATDETSYHGYPDPIRCPSEVARQSLALYYYTEEDRVVRRSTDYRARPEDRRVAPWIWLDKKAVAAYSWLKRRLGLSDALVSKVLRFLSRSR